jgi:hypothetical protein
MDNNGHIVSNFCFYHCPHPFVVHFFLAILTHPTLLAEVVIGNTHRPTKWIVKIKKQRILTMETEVF